MAIYAHSANPQVLRWARERAARSLDEVAATLKKDVVVITEWEEAGGRAPTFGQLEKLAALYRLPVAVFFFPKPPAKRLQEPEFRTLPKADIASLSSDMRFAHREALALQESLRELTGDRNPSPSPIVGTVSPRPRERVSEFCDRIRNHLGIDLSEQATWRDAKKGFREWRRAVQDAGVFVFKRPLKDEDVSGFCLQDPVFPVIVVDRSSAATRQTFTIFHELAHLLLGVDGMTKEDLSYVARLRGQPRQIEIRCNKIAAELLMPRQDFDAHLQRCSDVDDAIRALSGRYSVSREVVLRRLLDKELVSSSQYRTRVREWDREAKARRKKDAAKEPKPLYYPMQRSYFGDAFLRLAFAAYHDRRCTLADLTDHLRMKAPTVQKFEDHLRRLWVN